MTDIAIEYDRKQILHPLYTEEGVAAKPLAMRVSEVAMQVSEFSILQLAGGARLRHARAGTVLDAQIDIVWRVVEARAILAHLLQRILFAQHVPQRDALLHICVKSRQKA